MITTHLPEIRWEPLCVCVRLLPLPLVLLLVLPGVRALLLLRRLHTFAPTLPGKSNVLSDLLSTRKPDHDPTCWECCRRLPVSEVPVGNLLFLRWSFNLEYLRNYPSTWYLQKVLLKAFDGSFKRRIQRWRLLVLNLFLQLLLFSNFLCTFGPFYSCLL